MPPLVTTSYSLDIDRTVLYSQRSSVELSIGCAGFAVDPLATSLQIFKQLTKARNPQCNCRPTKSFRYLSSYWVTLGVEFVLQKSRPVALLLPSMILAQGQVLTVAPLNTIVKMEERKRPIVVDQDDSAPPLKRQATSINGPKSSSLDADMPWKDDLEVSATSSTPL